MSFLRVESEWKKETLERPKSQSITKREKIKDRKNGCVGFLGAAPRVLSGWWWAATKASNESQPPTYSRFGLYQPLLFLLDTRRHERTRE